MRWRSRSALAGEAADEASGAAVLHGARGAPPCVVPSSISLPSGENLTEEKSIGPPASGVNVANGPFSYARTSYILVWPPPPDVHAAIRAAEEHRPASSSFIYFGHGPSLGELRPRLARLAAALARAGGASAVKPTQFGDMLRLHLRPHTLGSGARQIWQTLRQAEQAGSSAGVREKLLHEMVQARTSLEAFASSIGRFTLLCSIESFPFIDKDLLAYFPVLVDAIISELAPTVLTHS